MNLLPNEKKLILSDNDSVVLTNYRLYKKDKEMGQYTSVIIPLENISTIEVKYTNILFALFFGIICILGGVYFSGRSYDNQTVMYLGIFFVIMGIISILVWWFSKKHVISISSNGGSKLRILIEGMKDDKVNEFIYAISLAKHSRMDELYKL